MRRILIISGMVLAALIGVLLAAVFILPKTGPGQALVDRLARPAIEDVVRQQLGSEIDFARIEGGLPGEIVIEDLRLTADGEAWLTAERVRLEWSPLALLSKNVVVKELAVTDAALLRRPPPVPERPEEEPQPQSDQPFTIPDIRIDRLAIEPLTVHERVLGERYTVTLQAAAETLGGTIAGEAIVATAAKTDRVAVDVFYDKERLRAELFLEGEAEGLIARLADTDGPVIVTLDGEGPLDEWRGELMADLAAYGSASAVLTGDLLRLEQAAFDGAVEPGPALPDIAGQIVGDRLILDLAAAREGDEAIALSLTRAEGRFGELAGTVTLSSLSAEEVTADLTGRLSEEVAAEFGAEMFAGPLSLDARAAQADQGWRFAGTLVTDPLTLAIEDGVSDEERLFEGRVNAASSGLSFEAGPATPLLAQGLSARASVRYGADGTARVTGLDARIGSGPDRVAATGDARFDTETQDFAADLSLNAAAGALATLLGTGSYDGALTAEIDAQGTPERAALRLAADIPSGEIDGTAFPSGRLTADLSGLPGMPTGTARLVSAEGTYSGEVQVESRGDAILVPQLAFEAQGLTLTGNARLLPETRAGSAALTLDAGEGTTLLTGQTVAGRARLDASIAPDGGPVDIELAAQGFRLDDIRIDALRLDAEGPLEAIDWGVSLDDAELPGVFLALLNAAGQADLSGEERLVRIAELRAAVDDDVADNTVTLLEPTTVTLGDAITLDRTRLDWLGSAQLTASGRYGPDRWAAELRGEGLAIPGIEDASAEIDLSLDTDRPQPGQFTLSARAENEDGETVTLAGDGLWTGERVAAELVMTSPSAGDVASAEFSFPALLRRGETLGVDIPEEGLDALLRYEGPLAPVYAFAPVETRYLTGRLDGRIELTGAVTSPAASGKVLLSDGRFEEDQVGIVLRGIEGEADFAYSGEGTRVTLAVEATGADGRAESILLNGDVRMDASGSAVDVRLALDEAQLADTAELELRASGEMALLGALDDLRLEGGLDIGELDAAIPSLEGGTETTEYVPVEVVRVDGERQDLTGETEAPEPPLAIALDLSVTADNAIFVRGRGLDSEWSADLQIGGTTLAPVIGGEIALVDGTFLFAGRSFDLTEGVLDFRQGDEIDPLIDLSAAYETDDDVTAIISVSGPVSSPSLELSSDPALPDETILALILFGKQPTELSEIEALQLAFAVAQITGAGPLGGGPGIDQKLRSSLGLDALSFGMTESGAGVVEVGKYLTDDVYVSARQASDNAGTEVTVTYEITDHITVESTLQPDGAQSASANYKIDY